MTTLWFLLLIIMKFILYAVCRRDNIGAYREVRTTQGRVRGYQVQPDIYAYTGIPYAQSTFHNRFKAPIPPRRWDSIFEATHRIACLQSDGSGHENCLVINVFTPSQGTSLPVLVYVHEGDFKNGWGPTEPMKLLLRKNIIIVTFNYRLGCLGFLCLKAPEAPGNAGIKDQVVALYWINQNIANFGGNPTDVTVYGVESGAVSIQLLILSGSAERLFHKAILEAGSILSVKSMTNDPLTSAYNMAKSIDYTGDINEQELIKIFLKVPVRKLVNNTYHFLPCIETESYYSHSLLDKDPYNILRAGNFQNVPMILVYPDEKPPEEITIMDSILENLLPTNLEFPNDEVRAKVAELVKDFYFRDSEDYKANVENYIDNDLIHYHAVKIAALFAMEGTQPVYLMKHSQNVMVNKKPSSKFRYNIANLFYVDLNGKEELQNIIVTLWSNFIKLGDPTPLITESTPVIWQPIKMTSTNGRISKAVMQQLVYDGKLKLENAVTQQLLFWDTIYDKFYNTSPDLGMDPQTS